MEIKRRRRRKFIHVSLENTNLKKNRAKRVKAKIHTTIEKRIENARKRYYTHPKRFMYERMEKEFSRNLALKLLVLLFLLILMSMYVENKYGGYANMLRKTVIDIQVFFRRQNISPDTWINALASFLSSFATILGVYCTLKFEKHRDETNKVHEIKPQITILSLNEIATNNDEVYCGDFSIFDQGRKVFISNCLQIENISNNTAIDVQFGITIDGMVVPTPSSLTRNSISRIEAMESVSFCAKLEMPQYDDFNWSSINRYYFIRNKLSWPESIVTIQEGIENSVTLKGQAYIIYRDKEGNRYIQYHATDIDLYYASQQCYALILCQNWPTKTKKLKKNGFVKIKQS